MITQISMHMLKLLHDFHKGDRCPKWGRRGKWWRGLRGRGCRVCRGYIWRLHIRLLHSKLRCTPSNRLLAHGTHDIEERRKRNGEVQVSENVCDSWRKDELIACGSVSIAIYNRFYHMWWKVYRKRCFWRIVHASFVLSVEEIYLNSSLVTALNRTFSALLLKFAALIFASSQMAGGSSGYIQPTSIASHTFSSKDRKKAFMHTFQYA